MLFARDINLISIGETEFEYLFDFELSHVPTSLCTEMGESRYSKSKVVIQNNYSTTKKRENIKQIEKSIIKI